MKKIFLANLIKRGGTRSCLTKRLMSIHQFYTSRCIQGDWKPFSTFIYGISLKIGAGSNLLTEVKGYSTGQFKYSNI